MTGGTGRVYSLERSLFLLLLSGFPLAPFVGSVKAQIGFFLLCLLFTDYVL